MLEFPDLLGLVIDVAALAVIVGIGVYGARMLYVMKFGYLEKSWRLISIGSIFLAVGVCTFALVSVDSNLPSMLLVFNLGGVAQIIGGIFLMLGFRVQYKIFKVKMTLTKEQEKLRDLT